MNLTEYIRNVLSKYVADIFDVWHYHTANYEDLSGTIKAPRAYMLTNYIAMDIQKFKQEGWHYEFHFGTPQQSSDLFDRDWVEMSFEIEGRKK